LCVTTAASLSVMNGAISWKGQVLPRSRRPDIAHPESNGKLERLHRTHREEGLTEESLKGYYTALDAMKRWDDYYNYKRPHSAIRYLVPADYYRGDPDDRIAERKEKLVQAVEMRQTYWQRENARDQGRTLT